MRVNWELILGLVAVLSLASCSSMDSTTVYSPGTESSTESETALEQQRAQAQAQEQERQRQAAVREAEARRVAEAQAAERRAEEQRLAQEQAAREAEEAARREAQRQRELAERRAAEQARIIAAQQARIEELRARIATNAAETESVEAANAVLRRAIATAEELNQALSEEEEKYNNADQTTGELSGELNTARLEELASEVESLSNQAQALMSLP